MIFDLMEPVVQTSVRARSRSRNPDEYQHDRGKQFGFSLRPNRQRSSKRELLHRSISEIDLNWQKKRVEEALQKSLSRSLRSLDTSFLQFENNNGMEDTGNQERSEEATTSRSLDSFDTSATETTETTDPTTGSTDDRPSSKKKRANSKGSGRHILLNRSKSLRRNVTYPPIKRESESRESTKPSRTKLSESMDNASLSNSSKTLRKGRSSRKLLEHDIANRKEPSEKDKKGDTRSRRSRRRSRSKVLLPEQLPSSSSPQTTVGGKRPSMTRAASESILLTPPSRSRPGLMRCESHIQVEDIRGSTKVMQDSSYKRASFRRNHNKSVVSRRQRSRSATQNRRERSRQRSASRGL